MLIRLPVDVNATGLVPAHQQGDNFSGVLRECFPHLLPLYQRLCPVDSYGPVHSGDLRASGPRVRDLCQHYGVSDRSPRPIIPGDSPTLNIQVVEALANTVCAMDMGNTLG